MKKQNQFTRSVVAASLSAVLGVIFLMSGVFAQAANAQPILQIQTGGGMPGPGGVASSKTVLYADGQLVETRVYHPSMEDWSKPNPPRREETKVLAVIKNQLFLDRVIQGASKIQGGELVPVDPSQPACADAPATFYSVFKAGKAVRIGGSFNCIEQVLADENQRYEASSIIRRANALTVLGY